MDNSAENKQEPRANWVNSHSWQPEVLPVLEAPLTVTREPGSIDYLRLGCDEMYTELGGEG